LAKIFKFDNRFQDCEFGLIHDPVIYLLFISMGLGN